MDHLSIGREIVVFRHQTTNKVILQDTVEEQKMRELTVVLATTPIEWLRILLPLKFHLLRMVLHNRTRNNKKIIKKLIVNGMLIMRKPLLLYHNKIKSSQYVVGRLFVVL